MTVMTSYANLSALVSTEWVAEHLADPGVRLLEVDVDTAAYGQGHLPGAVGVNWSTQLSDQVRRDILCPAAFERLMSACGVSRDTRIVFYGDNNNWFAAYAYWIARMYGHPEVALMNGGRKKWELEGRPLSTDLPRITPTSYRTDSLDLRSRAYLSDVLGYVDAPDGKALVAGSGGRDSEERWFGEAKVWEVATGREQAALRGHAGLVTALGFTADGKTLVTGGEDGTVKLWDAVTGQERAALPGAPGAIPSLAFRPDGKVLAVAGGGRDQQGAAFGEVRLWHVGGRPEVARLRRHGVPVVFTRLPPPECSHAGFGIAAAPRTMRSRPEPCLAVTSSRTRLRDRAGVRRGTGCRWAPARRSGDR